MKPSLRPLPEYFLLTEPSVVLLCHLLRSLDVHEVKLGERHAVLRPGVLAEGSRVVTNEGTAQVAHEIHALGHQGVHFVHLLVLSNVEVVLQVDVLQQGAVVPVDSAALQAFVLAAIGPSSHSVT